MKEKIPDAEHNQWLQHPTTKSEVTNLVSEINACLGRLLGAARNSSDPIVRGASARYEANVALMQRVFQERHVEIDTEE